MVASGAIISTDDEVVKRSISAMHKLDIPRERLSRVRFITGG